MSDNDSTRPDGGVVAGDPETERQLQYLPVHQLGLSELRDVRTHVVEDIADRIRESEYNPSRPMRVVKADDGSGFIVVDGNHRLSALQQIDAIDDDELIPCVIETGDVDLYQLAHESNQDEATFAEEDLFDHLDYIADLREDHTQVEIAERFGWSRSKVSDYSALLKNIVAGVLGFAKKHQEGRATGDLATATFSEGWFRTSGLYDLNRDGVDSWHGEHAQKRVMQWFVDEQNCDASKSAVGRKVEDVLGICKQLELLEEHLNAGVADEISEELRKEVIAGTYTDDTLNDAVENANHSAKDRAEFGTDAISGLQSVQDDLRLPDGERRQPHAQ